MQNRFTDTHFISAISEAEAFREKALEFFSLNIHQIAYIPKKSIVLTAQMHFKGQSFFTNNAPRFGQMHFKSRSLCHVVYFGASKADYRVHNVFTSRRAALIP